MYKETLVYRKSPRLLILVAMLQSLIGCRHNLVILHLDLTQPPNVVPTQAAVNRQTLEFEVDRAGAGGFTIHFTDDNPCRKKKNGMNENDLYGKAGHPARCIAGGIPKGEGLSSYAYTITYESVLTAAVPAIKLEDNKDPAPGRRRGPFTPTTPCRGCLVAGGSDDSDLLSRNAAALDSRAAVSHSRAAAPDLGYEEVRVVCKNNAVHITDDSGSDAPQIPVVTTLYKGIVWSQGPSAKGWSITFKTPICKSFDPDNSQTLDYNFPWCELTDDAIAKADPLNPYVYYVTIPACGSKATPFTIAVNPPTPQLATK